MLLVGVVLGVLLGPAVVGRLAPNVYEVLFVGGREEAIDLAVYEAQTQDLLKQLRGTGVSDEASEQLIRQRDLEGEPLAAAVDEARTLHALRLLRAMIALVAAMLIVMLCEPLLAAGAVARERCTTIRYALGAILVVLALARPQVLAQLPWLFLGLLLVVALVAAFVPLGKAGEQEIHGSS